MKWLDEIYLYICWKYRVEWHAHDSIYFVESRAI